LKEISVSAEMMEEEEKKNAEAAARHRQKRKNVSHEHQGAKLNVCFHVYSLNQFSKF
jgi:hypothetical protein